MLFLNFRDLHLVPKFMMCFCRRTRSLLFSQWRYKILYDIKKEGTFNCGILSMCELVEKVIQGRLE